MFKRGHRDDRDLSEVEMMFMGIYGKEMTDLELLKIEEQDIVDRKMMCHHKHNSLRRSGHIGSDGDLTPKTKNISFESSRSSHGGGGAGNNVMPRVRSSPRRR